jgi:AraC-like DNA-binding protein/mannose-6-phosphate isomerase-like protein (cupin superfamily)
MDSRFSVRHYEAASLSRGRLFESGISFSRSAGCGFETRPERLSLRIILEGCSRFDTGQERLAVTPGEVLLIDAGVVHYNDTPAGTATRGLSIYFPREDLQLAEGSLFQTGLMLKMPSLKHDLALEINALTSQDWTDLQEENKARELVRIVAAKTRHALSSMEAWAKPLKIKRDVTRNRILGQLERARFSLEQNREASTNIPALARECGLSQFHFSRLFKTAFGTAPFQYHQHVRLNHAVEMLSDQTPSAVAHRLGYPDLATFSKAFKRVHGSAPTRFRGPSET